MRLNGIHVGETLDGFVFFDELTIVSSDAKQSGPGSDKRAFFTITEPRSYSNAGGRER